MKAARIEMRTSIFLNDLFIEAVSPHLDDGSLSRWKLLLRQKSSFQGVLLSNP